MAGKKRFNGLSTAEKAVAAMYCATGFNTKETALNLGRSQGFVTSVVSREKVDKQIQRSMKRAIMKLGVDPSAVAKRVAGIALTNATQLVDEFGNLMPVSDMPELARQAVKSIKRTSSKFGDTVTVELHSPDKSLDTVMKWLDISPKETETSINVGVAVNNVADCEINDRIEAIARGGRAELLGNPYDDEADEIVVDEYEDVISDEEMFD